MNVSISVHFPYAASATNCNHCKLDTYVCDVCDSELPMVLDFMVLILSPGILSM